MAKDLQSLVSELDRDLMREYRFDTDLFGELTDIQRKHGILHGERPICPFLRPYFLEASRYNAIRHAAQVLSKAFGSLTKAALESDELMEILGMTETEERFARFEPGHEHVSITSRLDTFLHPGGFKFLEYNAENPAGIGDQSGLETLFKHVPVVRDFLCANEHSFPQPHIRLLEVLDRAYREGGGEKERPNIAIVDWEGVDTGAEFEILKRFFESRGYLTSIFDPQELEYDGMALRAGSFEIDVFYKRVIISEFLERFDERHPISLACADGNVCMANSFRSKIPHKKSGFAILSDKRFHHLFSAAQIDVIDKHIPWTRNVRHITTTYGDDTIDLVEFIRTERRRCVLKPNDDYGGKGITFGWESTVSEWDDAIGRALSNDYVVQERVNVEKTEIPVYFEGEARIESLTVDFDPFLFMGEVEGGMVRLASGSLVNITQGGGETALVILEGI